MSTLCIGVDVTWWGGSAGIPASARETVISAVADRPTSLAIRNIDLSGAVNPTADDYSPNYDSDGGRLLQAIDDVVKSHGRAESVLVALDAPLEAATRVGQPRRRKAVARGVKTGAVRRACECDLAAVVSAQHASTRKAWGQDLKIQSGSPLAPRIETIVARLKRAGYAAYRGEAWSRGRYIVEVFPSEAIWAMGSLGCYGSLMSTEVRAYKQMKPSNLACGDAARIASRPLSGFVELAPLSAKSMTQSWVNQIAEWATKSAFKRRTQRVSKGKSFDDPIDSGISFLTAVALVRGDAHAWGDGQDGVIVGPGKWP